MNENKIGYLKYEGESFSDGYVDAKKQAEAILGFDESFRSIIAIENSKFQQLDYSIPVKIEQGSLIIFLGAISPFVFKYMSKAGEVVAEKGFSELGIIKNDLPKLQKTTLKILQSIVKISKHVGSIKNKKFKKIIPKEINDQNYVEITNDNDEVLLVLKKHHDIFIKIPDKILSKNVKLINSNEKLIIGVFEGHKEEVVEICQVDKVIFYDSNDDVDEEIILPDLKHGDTVTDLEGKINKVIENKNKFSFDYNNHIIDCLLEKGARVGKFKNKIISEDRESIFAKVKISGIVSREDKDGLPTAKKPKIILSNIKKIEGNKEINLFSFIEND